ncbi:MAG: hypothetical protein M0Z51_01625 [Propionibacterium sp.]|nr:hypothetical protein [Propionibacterium sp.]
MTGEPSTMVVHVSPRGKDATGLMRYLYGPGDHNEHVEQHMVFGSHGMAAAYPGGLNPGEATELGNVVELSWRTQMQQQLALVGASRGGISRDRLTYSDDTLRAGEKEHMYHLIVSLPPGAQWTDQQWEQVGWELVTGMGFTQGPDDDAGCKIVGVRHGLSAEGNDHLHIAINLVREDGRRATVPKYDFAVAQQVARQVEQTLDFVLPLRDPDATPGRSLPAFNKIEMDEARQRGQAVPDRVILQQVVRAAATAATTEEEWINAVLDHPGLSLEASRWAPGGRDLVTGYRVRIGEGRWLNGSQLAPDLTLGKLRPQWAGKETDETRAGALALWREDVLPADAATPGSVTEELHLAVEQLQQWSASVALLDPQDRAAWSRVLAEEAGLVASVARTDGALGRGLTRSAQTLARQALPPWEGGDRSAPVPHYGQTAAQLAARHVQLALRAGSLDQHQGWIAVLQQLHQVSQAIEAAHRARGELASARQLHQVSGVLSQTEQRLSPIPGRGTARSVASQHSYAGTQTTEFGQDQHGLRRQQGY